MDRQGGTPHVRCAAPHMSHQRRPLRGFTSCPVVVDTFTTYAERKDLRARGVHAAHDTAALALWSYIMGSPTQRWLQRLRAYIPPLPPHYDSGGVYVLISPCTRHFYIGQTNDFRRRMREHLGASARVTTRATAPVHRLLRGAGASAFVMLPMVYALPGDDVDALERIVIRRLRPSLNVSSTRRQRQQQPRRCRPGRPGTQRPALPATFSCGSTHCHDIVHLLRTINASQDGFSITCALGPWYLVNRRILLCEFGRSQITVKSASTTVSGSLRRLRPHLPTALRITVHALARDSVQGLLEQWKLAMLLHPDHTKRQLHSLPPRHLIKIHTLHVGTPLHHPRCFPPRPHPQQHVCYSCAAHAIPPARPLRVRSLCHQG